MMTRSGPTLLIEGYRPHENGQSAAGKVLTAPKGGNGPVAGSRAGSAMTQKLPKTTSSVHIPKK